MAVASQAALAAPTTGDITGTVTDASANPVAGFDVTAYQLNGVGDWQWVKYAYTAINGTYDISGLATGSYRVEFSDDHVGGYLEQYYNDKFTIDNTYAKDGADDVAVTAGQTTTGIDAVVTKPGPNTGMVTNASGNPVAGIIVTAFEPNGYGGWLSWSIITTGSDGVYNLSRLHTGIYHIDFFSPGYFDLFFNNKSTIAAADDVSITAGQTTSSIDAVLASSDTTPPTTTVHGADAHWHNTAVTLTLGAVDDLGGSGMGGQATTEYEIGSGSWAAGTTVIVPASADHSGDGPQTVNYKSCDAVCNWETVKSVTVKIDTQGPTTATKAATGKKGTALILKYRVAGNLSPRATTVVLTIRNSHKKVVRKVILGTKATGTWLSTKWTSKAAGKYTYAVSAMDLAGNKQATAGSAKITVR